MAAKYGMVKAAAFKVKQKNLLWVVRNDPHLIPVKPEKGVCK